MTNWLVECASYQGIADSVALQYMNQHGRISATAIRSGLSETPPCPKLISYWHFNNCGFRKLTNTCSRPDSFPNCPLPEHDLRNGRLNQTAYSLFFFLRDVADGDLVDWLDRRLLEADIVDGPRRGEHLAASIIEPMAHIYGLSNKVLTMSMSWLLLAGDRTRERWRCAGASMVAIDTLVHNWLWRTGILRDLDCRHA